MSNSAFWDRRYDAEGNIWTHQPSLTVLSLRRNLPKKSKVIEIGSGYGRDVYFLAKSGYQITAVEQSTVGFEMMEAHLNTQNLECPPTLLNEDFMSVQLPLEYYDAIYSHRVLHLLDSSEVIKNWVRKIFEILAPDGWLFISARDQRDKKPDRKGHHIVTWNENRFRQVFEDDFRIINFLQSDEIESRTNPNRMFFTLMIARKKSEGT